MGDRGAELSWVPGAGHLLLAGDVKTTARLCTGAILTSHGLCTAAVTAPEEEGVSSTVVWGAEQPVKWSLISGDGVTNTSLCHS